MKTYLQSGDVITLLSEDELLNVFEQRKFFDSECRKRFAKKLGGQSGVVSSIEKKYAYDYFFFVADNYKGDGSYSIPYESVNFSKMAE